MKKILLQLTIIGFILVSCKNNNLNDSYWLAVKSYPIPPETGNGIYDGITIHFTKDKILFGAVLDDRNGEFDFKVKNEQIFVNDTLWAEIFVKYQDSIILDITQNARVKFVKLDNKHSKQEKPEIWKHKNWILSNNNYKRELFLTDSLFFDEPNSKLCIQKDLQDNRFINTIDKWQSVNINGNQLFVKTFHQLENEFYRIKNYEGDSIIDLESLKFPNVKSNLRKRQYISESKRQETIDKIQNQLWKTNRILSLDTISQSSGDWDSTLIKLKSLKSKKISFKFSSDLTYNIYESDISMASGNWRLSQTGCELILNSGLYPSDYVDLINISSDSLNIGNLRRFEPIDYFGMDVEMYYKINLKK